MNDAVLVSLSLDLDLDGLICSCLILFSMSFWVTFFNFDALMLIDDMFLFVDLSNRNPETLPENPGAASHPPDGKKDPQGAFTSRKITLRSSDGDEFEVDEEVALESQFLQFATEYDCAIELPYVTSKMLSKAMEYCKKHVESRTGAVDDDLKAWDAEFVKVDQATLFDLIRVSPLSYFICSHLYNLI